MRKSFIVLITLLISIAFIMVGCESSEVELNEDEITYIEKLSTFSKVDEDKMRKYMDIYIRYRNSIISTEDLEFIESNTDKDLFENEVVYNFLTETYENTEIPEELIELYFNAPEGQQLERDGEGNIILEGDIIPEGDMEIPTESEISIDKVYYFFKDNIYAAKASRYSGFTTVIYFKVDNGKVVDIYEL